MKSLVFAAVMLLVGFIGLLVFGFASNTPGLLVVDFLCGLPLFALTLGAALGRATTELTIMRKSVSSQQQPKVRTGGTRTHIPDALG